MEEIKEVGKGGISAKIIADSISPAGIRITTLEIEVHRFVWSEFMTHRVFSRNAASSRAIPVARVLGMVWKDPVMPVHWGANRPGMQAKEELKGWRLKLAKKVWRLAGKAACAAAWSMMKLGVHKQVANRVTEPFVMMKAVVTSTEWDNFFELRDHPDADPHMQELARCMKGVRARSIPVLKQRGEWHLPYVEGSLGDINNDLAVSGSCCAQVSYRRLDTSAEKAENIFSKLIKMRPAHASPVEHQAMVPLQEDQDHAFSGNLRGWVQHRKILGL